jgi:hypothetical protein
MQYRLWVLSAFALFLGKLGVSSDAFFMIPNQYHGKWSVPGKTQGTFEVTTDSISAKFRSAELKLKPKSISPDDDEIFLHDMEIISHPSAFDIRSVWKNIGYFYAVRKHGIHLLPSPVEKQEDCGDSADDSAIDTIKVRWFIHANYSGEVSLTRVTSLSGEKAGVP